MARTTIRTEDITASEVTTAKMATDPTNASNLSSGSVPTAQLGNVNTSGLEDDIALLGFKVASNGSLAKYNLVDQTVDDFQDTSGVNAGGSTNEIRDASGKYYSGAQASVPTGGDATTTYTGYTVLSFTTTGSQNLVVPGTGDVDVLIVAGGGGGGGGNLSGNGGGAGGGAGGMRALSTVGLTAQTYVITVGTGGAGGTHVSTGDGAKGVDSSAVGYTATGGGEGAGYGRSGLTGGSGGGSAVGTTAGGAGNEGGYSPVEGYAGGTHVNDIGGAGGGGAGGTGYSNSPGGTPGNRGGNGGLGATNDFRTGSNVYYGGGSGGASGNYGPGGGHPNGGEGEPDAGGGGGGEYNSGAEAGEDGKGGGGGGGSPDGGSAPNETGGDGGNGIVVVRWADGEFLAYNDMTLVSTTTAAQEAPSKGDIVLTYTNGAGSTTLDTDLTAEISADGGSTWTALALGSEGSTGSHNIATSHDVTISSTITSPWNMAYRIKTLNQAVGKTTRIQAVSLGWS